MNNDHGRRFAVYSPTGVHIGLWPDGKIAAEVAAETPGNTVEELIRADHVDALIAASYVDAANLHQSLWRETSAYKTDQILKRTSTDTRQALDALLKAEREKALREAAEVCERVRTQKANGPMPEGACFDYEQSILALIKKDATDG